MLLEKDGSGWWPNPWYQVGAACRLLCQSKLAEFILHAGPLCGTALHEGQAGLAEQHCTAQQGPDCSGYLLWGLLSPQCTVLFSQDHCNTFRTAAELMQAVSGFWGSFLKLVNHACKLLWGISAKCPCSPTVCPGVYTQQLLFCNKLVHTKLWRPQKSPRHEMPLWKKFKTLQCQIESWDRCTEQWSRVMVLAQHRKGTF